MKTQFNPGNCFGFQPGQSGNPRGVSETRDRFRAAYVVALAGGGGDAEVAARAQELADLAWSAARKGEAWAYAEIRGQLAPLIAAAELRIGRTEPDDGIDFGKLSDEQLAQLAAILETAGHPGVIDIGMVAQLPEGGGNDE